MPAAWGRESRFAVIGAVLCIFASCPNNDSDSESNEVVPARISPARVENIAAPSDASAWALFDRNTRVGWSPPDDAAAPPVHIRVALGKTTTITHLKIFGASRYVLDVHTGKGDPIKGLEHVRLDTLGAGWNELRLPASISTDELVFEVARADDGDASTPTPVGEIELWGTDHPAMVIDEKALGAVTARSGSRPVVPPGVDVLAATGTAAIDLAPSTEPGGQICGKLHFSLTRSPASYRRAWFAYAADGAFRSFVLTRSLNAAPMRRGQWFST